MLKNSMILQES